MNICRVCGKAALLTCSRCKTVFYCAPACQSRDWSKHKGSCVAAAVGGPDAVSSTAAATTASASAEQISSGSHEYGLCEGECGEVAVLRCAGCLGAFYCGQACQKRAWKQHKEQCKFAATVIAEMKGSGSIDDLDNDLTRIKEMAEAGIPLEQLNLGNCFYNGWRCCRQS